MHTISSDMTSEQDPDSRVHPMVFCMNANDYLSHANAANNAHYPGFTWPTQWLVIRMPSGWLDTILLGHSWWVTNVEEFLKDNAVYVCILVKTV